MKKLFISWEQLIETSWEFMKSSLEQGSQPDLITELSGWLDAVLYDYGGDYEIILEGCDFRIYKLYSYEDILNFIEAYEEELNYDNELFYEELNKEVEP
jgi:hypothetical protein